MSLALEGDYTLPTADYDYVDQAATPSSYMTEVQEIGRGDMRGILRRMSKEKY